MVGFCGRLLSCLIFAYTLLWVSDDCLFKWCMGLVVVRVRWFVYKGVCICFVDVVEVSACLDCFWGFWFRFFDLVCGLRCAHDFGGICILRVCTCLLVSLMVCYRLEVLNFAVGDDMGGPLRGFVYCRVCFV